MTFAIYYQDHADSVNASAIEWQRAHPEATRAIKRRYSRNNHEKEAALERRRQARKREAFVGDPYTKADVIEKYGTTCYLCGHPVDPNLCNGSPWAFTIEHVIPLGPGPDSLENVRPAHRHCNSRKSNRLLSDITDFPWDPPPPTYEEEAS